MKQLTYIILIFIVSSNLYSQKFVVQFGPSVGLCTSRGLNKLIDYGNENLELTKKMEHMRTYKGWYFAAGGETNSGKKSLGFTMGFAFQKSNFMVYKHLVGDVEHNFAIQPRLFSIMPFNFYVRIKGKIPTYFSLSLLEIARFSIEEREGSVDDIKVKSGYRTVKPIALGSWYPGVEFGFTFPYVDLVFHVKNTLIGAFDHSLKGDFGQTWYDPQSYRYGEIGVDLRFRIGGYN